MTPADIARFESKIDRDGPIVRPELGRCWVWAAATFRRRGGYGAFGVVDVGPRGDRRKRVLKAHRVAFEIAHGRPPGVVVRHRCDNPPCVRPDHLLEGEHADNTRDKQERGRVPRGECHWRSKLTEAAVAEIRSARASGATLAALASRHGVCVSTISMLCSGQRWARYDRGSA